MKQVSFTAQIALSMAAAVLTGLALQLFGCEAWADRLFAPGGRIFLNLIKFIVCPLVLFSVLGGIVSMDDVKKVGILGAKTVSCFLVTTLVAIAFALAASLAVKGIFPVLKTSAAAAAPAQSLGAADMLTGFFPDNFARPFIDANMLQVVAIALTSTLASIGTAGAPGAGIAMLTMVLSAAGLPLDGIALVAGVDRIFDMGRTVLNIVGDTTAATVIGVRRGS